MRGAVAESRFGALDALRAGAMFLGVCLHGAVSYMSGRMPGLLWVVHDKRTHYFFDALFWWLHSFRLPLFFFLAGFFAALVSETRGPGGLLAQRVRRLLVPFLASCLIFLPISFYIWAAGWLVGGHCTVKEVLAIKFGPEIQQELLGPMHLWFLQDLFLLTAAWCAWKGAGRLWRKKRMASGRPARERPGSPWLYAGLPLWLSAATFLVLAANPGPGVEHHNSFLPQGWRLLHYGVFFCTGTALYPRRKEMPEIFRHGGLHLALSVPAVTALLLVLPGHLEGRDDWGTRLTLAGTIALTAWLSLFGFLGLALRCWNDQRPALRYLADASYWVYLCHLPLVGLVQLDLEGVALAAGVKFLLVVGLTTAVSLASYQTLVRHTFLGNWLHGPRPRRLPQSTPPAQRSAA
jgi:hypothetical protein